MTDLKLRLFLIDNKALAVYCEEQDPTLAAVRLLLESREHMTKNHRFVLYHAPAVRSLYDKTAPSYAPFELDPVDERTITLKSLFQCHEYGKRGVIRLTTWTKGQVGNL